VSAICEEMGQLRDHIQRRWCSEDSDLMIVSGIAVAGHQTNQTKREFFFGLS
jgi:hypothetical protein